MKHTHRMPKSDDQHLKNVILQEIIYFHHLNHKTNPGDGF